MKNLTLIYCGEDGDAGKALAETLRKDTDNKVILCSCEFFIGPEADADKVIIMPDVPEWRAQTIREAYPNGIVESRTQLCVKDLTAIMDRMIASGEAVTTAEMVSQIITDCNKSVIKDAMSAPKKRGWPKGKPRKAVA